MNDRAAPALLDLEPRPVTGRDHPRDSLLRLLGRLPLIRFACELSAEGACVAPLLVEDGGALDLAALDGVGERWDLLCTRMHPDDTATFRPGERSGTAREIRIFDGARYRTFSLADEVSGQDRHEIWQGALVERPAEPLAEHLTTIAAHLPGALYRCVIENGITRCTFVSPAVTDVFGVTAQAFLNSPEKVLENVHAEDRGRLLEAWRAAAAARTLFDSEFRVVVDGDVRWVRSIAQMTDDGSGRVMAVGIAVDVTARRRFQQELERRNSELLTLCRISEIALTSPTVASGLEEIAGEIARHLRFPRTVIAVYDESAQVITFRGSRYRDNLSAGAVRVPIRDTLSWECIRTGLPVFENDALRRPERRFTFTRQSGNQTFIGVPIKIGERAIGCLSVAHPQPLERDPSIIELLASYADYIASFIASKGHEELMTSSRSGRRSISFEGAFASRLTPRQREVLHILASGKSNKTIAQELGLQEATVKIHVRAILRALGVRNRTQAAMVANSVDRRPQLPAAMGRAR